MLSFLAGTASTKEQIPILLYICNSNSSMMPFDLIRGSLLPRRLPPLSLTPLLLKRCGSPCQILILIICLINISILIVSLVITMLTAHVLNISSTPNVSTGSKSLILIQDKLILHKLVVSLNVSELHSHLSPFRRFQEKLLVVLVLPYKIKSFKGTHDEAVPR